MSSDVTFSLTNALVDFGAARRIDPKGLETIQNTPSDEAAKTPRFDHLVSDHEQASRLAAQARTRSEAPEPQRHARAADRRPAPARPEPRRAERPEAPARPEDEAAAPARKDEAPAADSAAAKADVADASARETANERVRAGDEAGKSETTEAASGTQEGNAGVVTAAPPAQTPPAATPVADPNAVEAVLLADAAAITNPAAAIVTDAVTAQAQTGAVLAATIAGAADVPPTSVPTVGSASSGVAAPELEVALLAAKAAMAGETGKAETQAGTAQATTEAEAGGETDTAASTPTIKPGLDAKAQLAALAEGGTKASGAETGKVSGLESASEKSGTGKTASANLHPTRAAHFAEMLDGFMGSSAIHRPTDILAGLDRPVAAQAMNRSSDIVRPTPLQMLPIEIGMQAVRGVTSFQIRLDPAELGRVDVKLHIQDNGEVKANLIVDRVDTLNMLRRDASTLQNAFDQAGLKQSPDGLTFSLRGEGQQGQQQEQGRQGGRHASDISDDLALQAQIGEAAMRRVLIPNSSIDRMV